MHLHEPVAPIPGWDSLMTVDAPLVATFHCYSENVFSNNLANFFGARRRLNRLHVRIAVSQAAAWTGRRFFGGTYRVIPNGVDVPGRRRPRRARAEAVHASARCGSPSSARPSSARACRCCCAPSRRCASTSRRRCTSSASSDEELAPLMLDPRDVVAHGKCSDEEKTAVLAEADVLCAPSLGGESFGMVLTEAFAAGTPVVASDIAGYRDVVDDGVNGVLVPRGDPTALAEALRDLALDPRAPRRARRRGGASRPRATPGRRVAAEVLSAYEDAIALHAAAPQTVPARLGLAPADGERVRAQRLPTLEPALGGRRRRTPRGRARGWRAGWRSAPSASSRSRSR